MKDEQKFKNWLKENYSCAKCNKEFFSFVARESIQIFYYCRPEVKPEDSFSFDGKRICFDCYKKTIDKNGSSPYNIGICATDYIQKIYEIYQTQRDELRKIPIPDMDLEKVIEYAKTNRFRKMLQMSKLLFFY